MRTIAVYMIHQYLIVYVVILELFNRTFTHVVYSIHSEQIDGLCFLHAIVQ